MNDLANAAAWFCLYASGMHVKLTRLLRTEDGRRLLAGYRRASDILRREEEKDCRKYCGKPDPCLYLQKEERNLAVAVVAAKQETIAAVARDDFAAAMHAVSRLGPIVDAFFAKVMIDVPAADRRENRLKLLNEMREAARAVADFSKAAAAPSVPASLPQAAMAEAAAAP